MAKNKGIEPTPAEKYLRQLDPDKAQIRWRDLLYVSKKETDSLYKPVHKFNTTKLSRIESIMFLIIFPIALIVIVSSFFEKSPFLVIIFILILFSIGLILFLTARDGLRPKNNDHDDDE